jgi:hypothetical protein
VVVGADAVSGDDGALRVGAALAVAFGARLSVLHAWSDVVDDAAGLHRTTAGGTELAARAVHELDRCLGPVPRGVPRAGGRAARRRGHRPARLLGQVPGARMLVVGRRRARTGDRLGSTSRGLAAFAPCTVVVV